MTETSAGGQLTRPADCPTSATIDAALTYLEAVFALVKDSDSRARAIDQFNARVPTGCLNRAQASRLHALSATQNVQALGEEASFDIFGSGLYGFITRIAVGILGVVLIVVGFIMIGGEATLNQAASRFGKALGAGVKGIRK